jgi:putative ABC transport system permease protein
VFASVEDYEKFEDEARDAGLSDDYTITSNDLTQYESSLTPLENLSSFAGWFLVIVLIIGAIILVVFNIFNIRNRKYEIGVLTAIGMKKWKVAFQFMTETFVVTFVAIILGAIIGAATSVPVTNALLENQISSTESQSQQVEENFGRGGMDDNAQKSDDNKATDMKADKGGFMGNMMDKATNYVDSVSSATDLMVILELILMGLALTIVSSMASVVFVMRYEPLKILTQRD